MKTFPDSWKNSLVVPIVLWANEMKETAMDKDKRRFLKLLGKGFVVMGSGMIGIPLGACQRDPGYQALADLGPDLLSDARIEEMSQEEIDAFIDEVDARAAEIQGDSASDAAGSEIAEDGMGGEDDGSEPDGNGMPEVPPGQHVVESLPTLGTNPNPRSMEDWMFYVKGEVEEELELTWEEFNTLEKVDQVIDHHCVTGWTMLNLPTRGVPMQTLLDMAGLTNKAKHVIFDCEHGYTTNIALAEAMKAQVQIETHMWGDPLLDKYGGPARGRVPHLYGYKSGKWVIGIRISEVDEPGFWEKLGYSNTADPWTQDRYS